MLCRLGPSPALAGAAEREAASPCIVGIGFGVPTVKELRENK